MARDEAGVRVGVAVPILYQDADGVVVRDDIRTQELNLGGGPLPIHICMRIYRIAERRGLRPSLRAIRLDSVRYRDGLWMKMPRFIYSNHLDKSEIEDGFAGCLSRIWLVLHTVEEVVDLCEVCGHPRCNCAR